MVGVSRQVRGRHGARGLDRAVAPAPTALRAASLPVPRRTLASAAGAVVAWRVRERPLRAPLVWVHAHALLWFGAPQSPASV